MLGVSKVAFISFLVASIGFGGSGLTVERKPTGRWPRVTCDPGILNPESYRITTEAIPSIWMEPLPKLLYPLPEDVFDLQYRRTVAVTDQAVAALDLDERNLMAHNILARNFLVFHNTWNEAKYHWQVLFQNGKGVTFDAVIYSVDGRSMFIVRLTPEAIEVYRYGQFGRMAMGYPPATPKYRRFWLSHNGCIPPEIHPDAAIPWTIVREIKSKRWVQDLKLRQKVTLSSDRGKKKTTNKLRIAFLGGIGHAERTIDWYNSYIYGYPEVKYYTYGPADYNERLRDTLLAIVDPKGRIRKPKASKSGIGW